MKTIIDLFEISTQKYADNPYILEKKSDRYEAITYKRRKNSLQSSGRTYALV